MSKHIGSSGTPRSVPTERRQFLDQNRELQTRDFAFISRTSEAYAISADGIVISLTPSTRSGGIGIELTQCANKSGYYYVCFRREGRKDRRHFIHRLVAETFTINSDLFDAQGRERNQVNHLDSQKSNNKLSNLVYMSASENVSWNSRVKVIQKEREELTLTGKAPEA